MTSNWSNSSVHASYLENRIDNVLFLVGVQCVSYASENLRTNGSVKSANLLNSLTCATSKQSSEPQGETDGTPISAPTEKNVVRIGTNVVYAARIEFGFTDTDSLGRVYDQAEKPYLRPAVENNSEKITKFIQDNL